MKVIASYSLKGGVGKTSVAVNLAAEASAAGWRTLLWDLDPQGAAGFHLAEGAELRGGARSLVGDKDGLLRRVHHTHWPGLDLIPADIRHLALDSGIEATKRPEKRIRRLLKPLRDSYDVAILDCAPSLGATAESVFHAVDALLVPVIPSALSLRTLYQLDRYFAGWQEPAPRRLAFFSMVDRRRRLHTFTLAHPPRKLAEFLDTSVPNAAQVERMGERGAPIRAFAPHSIAAQAYATLWRELTERLALHH